MIKLVTLILVFFALASEKSTTNEPAILNDGKDKVIVINDELKNILNKWDSKAKILESDNFSSEIWSLYTEKDPNSLPMAAVGDYNGDALKDLGLLVLSGNTIKAIVALSSKSGYSIKVIKSYNLNTSGVMAKKTADSKMKLNIYLFAEHRQHLKHKKGLSLRDGFQVEMYDSADTTVHYAINGSFTEYKGLIK